jgi:hypothetical protein
LQHYLKIKSAARVRMHQVIDMFCLEVLGTDRRCIDYEPPAD